MTRRRTNASQQGKIGFGVALVAAAYFMEMLDGTVIATALPRMAQTFQTTAVRLNIGITAYLLAIAVCIPATGWLADRIGTRTVFTWSVAIFTLASLLCGFSTSVAAFVLARIVQGIGGAMMVPVGRLVVLHTTERKDLLRWIAYITWPGLVAPVLGPPLGGWITQVATWRWIFYLNVPLGIAALLLSFVWIKDHRSETSFPFDWKTFCLSGTACTAFVAMVEYLSEDHPQWSLASLTGLTAMAAGVLMVRSVKRTKHPLFGLEALSIRSFAVTIYGGSLFRIAISVSPFLLPLMFQLGLGMDAFHSGLLLLSLFAGNLCMKPFTTPILRRYGFKRILIASGFCLTIATLLCGVLSTAVPIALMIGILVFNGLCRSMQFTSVNTLGFVDVPTELTTSANTLQSTVQQLTLGMGAAVGALAVRVAHALLGSAGEAPVLKDFQVAFWMVSVLALVSTFDYFRLPANAGDITTRRRA